MEKKEEIWSFNRSTGRYEGALLIEVEAEIFRRMVLLEVEKDESADLTHPHTWMQAVARVGSPASWIGKPHVKVSPIASVQRVKEPQQKPEPLPKTGGAEENAEPSLEQVLRVKAQHVAPHLWEKELLTPIPAEGSAVEKRPFYQARHREYQVLDKLREELKRGDLVLDDEAAQQQKEYEATQDTKLDVQLETVAASVNGSRFH